MTAKKVAAQVMNNDLFTNLPREIIIDILSNLPIPTIMNCKRVCKSWRDSIESLEFPDSHLISQQLLTKEPFKVLEFIDEVNPFSNESFSFRFPHHVVIRSSLDGLLFFSELGGSMLLYICNPITGEYIKFCRPLNCSDNFGFGVSKITRQYKLVNIDPPKCEVYTLGTECWRSIPIDRLHSSALSATGVFLNGNLHWLALDFQGTTTTLHIYGLDLETELFSTFSLLSLPRRHAYRSLSTLRGCLCFLGSDSDVGEIVIWLMKEYGDENSWTRAFVIQEECPWKFLSPKIFNFSPNRDGELLSVMGLGGKLVVFSTKTDTIRTIDLHDSNTYFHTLAFTYTRSFRPLLKSLVKENVRSLEVQSFRRSLV